SAKTSAILESGDYKQIAFVPSGGEFVINDPEPGLLRVSVNGDWTNAGRVSVDITIKSSKEKLPRITARGRIEHLDFLSLPIDMPSRVSTADFMLSWTEDWSQYPTADLDLFLVDPLGNVHADAF